MSQRYGQLRQQLLCLVLLLTLPAVAQATFNASVSPPRFEIKTAAGKVIRQVINITNHNNEPARYQIKTADWELLSDGGVSFDEGTPNKFSCRPWVRIERHKLVVNPNLARPYRFEIHVPDNAPNGQCRFSLLIEPDPETVEPLKLGNISFPAVGRIAVIVYVTIGRAQADLKLLKIGMRDVNGSKLPALTLRNDGNAHGRLFGTLAAKDAKGKRMDLIVDTSPILPGRTRDISLQPSNVSGYKDDAQPYEPVAPIHIRGKLEWDGGSLKIDKVIGVKTK